MPPPNRPAGNRGIDTLAKNGHATSAATTSASERAATPGRSIVRRHSAASATPMAADATSQLEVSTSTAAHTGTRNSNAGRGARRAATPPESSTTRWINAANTTNTGIAITCACSSPLVSALTG
jgi:hypothetical protein